MNNRIIGWTLFLGISTLLAVGCSNNNTELASNSNPVIISTSPEEQQMASKKERYTQLKLAFETEKMKLEAMPSGTPEEIEKNVEQGRKVKEIGWEAGLLEKEVDPDYPRRELESKLVSSKRHFNGNELLYHYKRTNNPKYEVLFKLLEYKKEQLTHIEKEYQEKTTSIPQLLQELDELIRIGEIPKYEAETRSTDNKIEIVNETKTITAKQLHEITKDMNYKKVVSILGNSKDMGSGRFIISYEYEGSMHYILNFGSYEEIISDADYSIIQDLLSGN